MITPFYLKELEQMQKTDNLKIDEKLDLLAEQNKFNEKDKM